MHYLIIIIIAVWVFVSISSAISSCSRSVSDAVFSFTASELDAKVADKEETPLAAEFGVTAMSIDAMKQKERALKEEIEALHDKYRNKYAEEAKLRFERETARRGAVKKEKESFAEALRNLENAADKRKDVIFQIRDFALKESPVLWEARQNIRAEIELKDLEIEKLKGSAENRDVDIQTDESFTEIIALRNMLVRHLRNVEDKISEAYLMKCKFDATPTEGELERSVQSIIQDGIMEAERANKRYQELEQMRDSK